MTDVGGMRATFFNIIFEVPGSSRSARLSCSRLYSGGYELKWDGPIDGDPRYEAVAIGAKAENLEDCIEQVGPFIPKEARLALKIVMGATARDASSVHPPGLSQGDLKGGENE